MLSTPGELGYRDILDLHAAPTVRYEPPRASAVNPHDPVWWPTRVLIVPGQAGKRLRLNPLGRLVERAEQSNLSGRFVADLDSVIIEPGPLCSHAQHPKLTRRANREVVTNVDDSGRYS